MIHRPRRLNESTLFRTGTGLCLGIAVTVTPLTMFFASAARVETQVHIAVGVTLVLIMTAALLVGLAREVLRGIRQLQVLVRARRRRGATREAAMLTPMPA